MKQSRMRHVRGRRISTIFQQPIGVLDAALAIPGIAILRTALAFNTLGEALRQALDPIRQRR